MNIAVKNVKILMKSALPRTMNGVQEGCRFKLQKRDYSVISEASWISAVSDTMWLSKKYAYQVPNSPLMHLIPSFGGSSGITFLNEFRRYQVNQSGEFENLPKRTPRRVSLLRLESFKNVLMDISPSDLKTKEELIFNSKAELSVDYAYEKTTIDCMKQTEWEKTLTPSTGVDDEALCFSTNFVLMAFLVLMVVLLRDI